MTLMIEPISQTGRIWRLQDRLLRTALRLKWMKAERRGKLKGRQDQLKKSFGLLFVGLALLNGSSSVRAQGPPITTDTAFVNGLEGAAFRSFLFTIDRSGLVSGGESSPDPLDRNVSILGIPIVVPYEILPNRLVMAVGVPILHKEMRRTSEGKRSTLSTTGLGDLFISTKYRAFQRDARGWTTRMAIKGKVKFPTGKDDETDEQGNRLPPTLQLGSGSVDYSLGAVFTHVRRRVGFNADVSYNFKTEANKFAFGDSLQYGLAFGYRLLPVVYAQYPARNHINAYLELNGEYSARSRADGLSVVDSGWNVVYLSPGIQLIPGNFIVEASLKLPVVQNLKGSQLKFQPGFTVGGRWLIR